MNIKNNNEWLQVKIGDLCSIQHGYAFKGEYFSNTGEYILLTPGNFTEKDGLVLKGNNEKYYIGAFPKEYILITGDLLLVLTDLKQDAPYLGAPGIVKIGNKLLHNQRLGLVKSINRELVDKAFLYWVFQSDTYRSQVKGSATGSTVRHTAPERIYSCKIYIPKNITTQQKIAAILSAYDDLIENNTRRIQILEEMAKMIYQEWFVKFCFPGYERTKFVESPLGMIPEGWSLKKLGELASVNRSSIAIKQSPKTINYIDISSVSLGKIEKIEEIDFEQAPGRARRIVQHGDVIWSCVRPNRKSYALILNPIENLIVSTGFAVLTPILIPYSYLYQAVTTDAFVGYLTNHATGAAYPAVNTEDFKNAEILLPDEKILEFFHERIYPMLVLKQNFLKKNEVLKQTRDLLLPKLISGQIDVSDLDI